MSVNGRQNQRTDGGYAEFCRFVSKIGYYSNVPWAIAKRRSNWSCPPILNMGGHDPENLVKIDRSNRLWDNWSVSKGIPLKTKKVTSVEHNPFGIPMPDGLIIHQKASSPVTVNIHYCIGLSQNLLRNTEDLWQPYTYVRQTRSTACRKKSQKFGFYVSPHQLNVYVKNNRHYKTAAAVYNRLLERAIVT